MKSMEEMMQAAQQAAETIQKQMGDMQVKLDSIEVEGQAGGGLVKVRASAKGRILGVTIDDSLMKPEEKQMVEDLEALNARLQAATEELKATQAAKTAFFAQDVLLKFLSHTLQGAAGSQVYLG